MMAWYLSGNKPLSEPMMGLSYWRILIYMYASLGLSELMTIFWKITCGHVNSLWPNYVIWWHWSGSTLAQVMACIKPLHEPMLTYQQRDVLSFTWEQFHTKKNMILIRTMSCVQKLHFENYYHISQGPMSAPSLVQKKPKIQHFIHVVLLQVKHWKDAFLVLTSDGITDVVGDQEMVSIVASCKTPLEGAQLLTDQALHFGSRDNVTALVVPFGSWGTLDNSQTSVPFSFIRNVVGSRFA